MQRPRRKLGKSFTDSIRKEILAAREHGWTQSRIAKKLRTSEGSLSAFISGRWGIGSELLDRLADLLGLRVVIDPNRRRAPPQKKKRGRKT